MNYFNKTLILLATHLTRALIAILCSIIVARTLGPEGKGAIALFISFTWLVSIVMSCSLENGISYYLSRNRKLSFSFFIFIILISFFLFILILISMLSVKSLLLNTLFPYVTDSSIVIISMYISFLIFNRLIVGFFQGSKSFNSLSLPSTFAALLLLLSFVALHFFGFISVFNIVSLYIISSLIILFINLYLSRRIINCNINKFDSSKFIETIKYSVKIHFGSVFREINYRLDYFVLSF